MEIAMKLIVKALAFEWVKGMLSSSPLYPDVEDVEVASVSLSRSIEADP
jgi:hypothetical protein